MKDFFNSPYVFIYLSVIMLMIVVIGGLLYLRSYRRKLYKVTHDDQLTKEQEDQISSFVEQDEDQYYYKASDPYYYYLHSYQQTEQKFKVEGMDGKALCAKIVGAVEEGMPQPNPKEESPIIEEPEKERGSTIDALPVKEEITEEEKQIQRDYYISMGESIPDHLR